MRKVSGVMEIPITLTVMVVSQVHIYAPNYQVVRFQYVHYLSRIVSKLYNLLISPPLHYLQF